MRNHLSPSRAFTLIEVLVVVAIIALLVAILLPSLARARDQAQTMTCRSNLRQLHTAFTMYAHDNKGQYPGSTHDFGMDWLGYDNQGSADWDGHGYAPESGVIWRYMSSQSKAYSCPAHPKPNWADAEYWYYSYQLFSVMSGAKPEQVNSAHHPRKNFTTTEHYETPEHPMEYLDSAPLLVEALIPYPQIPGRTAYENSWWVGDQALANRHLRSSGRVGVSNTVFVDGHADGFRLPGLPENVMTRVSNGEFEQGEGVSNYGDWSNRKDEYFNHNALCVQMRSGKWISARALNANWSSYGFLSWAPSADVGSFTYPDERVAGDVNENNAVSSWDPIYHPGE